MSYISDNLCHFVGRSKDNDDERFELLVKIIKEQRLKANLENPDSPALALTSNYKGERLGEILEKCDCVCFCDIPDDMLEIHTSKYSQFGMGFSKPFLSKLGVRPVMYVPRGVKIKEASPTNNPTENPFEYYLYLSNIVGYMNAILIILNNFFRFDQHLGILMDSNSIVKQTIESFNPDVTKKFLTGHAHQMIFGEMVAWATQSSYVKIFDETLAEDNPDNYYMEREWRSLKSIDFTLTDIQKIYLPSQKYKDQFMEEFPDYPGEFWLFDMQ